MIKLRFAKQAAILIAAALLGASCSKQEPVITQDDSQQEVADVSVDSLKALFAEPVNKTAFVSSVYSWMTNDRIRVAAAEGGTIDFKYSGLPSAGEVTFVKNEDYHVKKAYVLSNAREITTKGKITYLPIYDVMFLGGTAAAQAAQTFN